MTDLRSQILVQALIRRAQVQGAFALVRDHGDDDAGSVLVMINTLDGKANLFGQTRDEGYNRVWENLCPSGTDYRKVEAILTNRLKQDRDLWVVEIEDKNGRNFLTEAVL
ncbi:MAG: DUF1491 family protein [Robiginitomaculum sp.]|nr:DUF1491 family protein [Robiginitomaculum sp.]